MSYPVKLKDVKITDFFTLKDYGDEPSPDRVYVRGGYDRTERKYDCFKFCDMCDSRLMRGDRIVYVGFTF